MCQYWYVTQNDPQQLFKERAAFGMSGFFNGTYSTHSYAVTHPFESVWNGVTVPEQIGFCTTGQDAGVEVEVTVEVAVVVMELCGTIGVIGSEIEHW